MANVLCRSLFVVLFAFMVSAQVAQVDDPCDVGDHEDNLGSYRPHPNDCSKYLQCLHGRYGERSCSPGTHWNAVDGACDWPQKAACQSFNNEQKNVVGGPCNVGDHEDNTGLYVEHPGDCGKYLQCLHGTFGERPCPDGLHWNIVKTACDWPQKANCVRTPPYPVPQVQNV